MKLKAFYNPFTYLMAFILLIAACSKEGPAGPAGPAGPTGANGANGANGATGAQGTKGDTGTANVIYSAWLDQTFTFDNVDSVYFTTIAVPKLTNLILARGVVRVYWNIVNATNPLVVPLPYADGGLLFGIPLIMNPYYSIGSIEILANANVSSRTDATAGKIFQYRYVLIPGGTTARSAVDLNNYAEVKKYYNLPD